MRFPSVRQSALRPCRQRPSRPFLAALPAIVAGLLVVAPGAGVSQEAGVGRRTSCVACHSDVDLFGPAQLQVVESFGHDVHAGAGLSCHDCHGGNPDPVFAEDMSAAMDESFASNPYRGVPDAAQVPAFCGRCHLREAELFLQSPKAAGFAEHNGYLFGIRDDGCAFCHEAPEPQAEVTDIYSFGGCASCHGNHGMVRPTLAFLSPLPDTPCAFCHEGAAAATREAGDPEGAAGDYEQARSELLALAADMGIDGEDRFDWLVDMTLTQPSHTMASTPEGGAPRLRPAFERLFTRFRIGKTFYEYEDPGTGELVRAPVLRCAGCHADEDFLGDQAHGRRVAAAIINRLRELTARIAEAERAQLAARRSGVDTQHISTDIGMASDSLTELVVLLHSFSTDEGSEFLRVYAEGMVYASGALEAAREALDEGV